MATEGEGLATSLKAGSPSLPHSQHSELGGLEGSHPGHRWETGCGSDGASPQERVLCSLACRQRRTSGWDISWLPRKQRV